MVMSFLNEKMVMYVRLSGGTKIKRATTTHLKDFQRIPE